MSEERINSQQTAPTEEQTAQDLNEQCLIRREKLAALQAEGRDPVKALEDELKFRQRIKLDTLLTKKELDKACENYKAAMLDSVTALALATLWDEFGFGGKRRLPRFADAFRRNVEAFFEGNLTWEMIEDTLKTECGITIDLSDDLAARR